MGHQTRKILALFVAVAICFGYVAVANAQTNSDEQPFQVPATAAKKKVVVVAKAMNKKTNRLLGDVKIEMAGSSYTIVDPPPPNGFEIPEITADKTEIIATRKGYQRYDENISIPDDKTYYNLEIKLEPEVGTPDVSQQQRNVGASWGSVSGYPSSYNGSYYGSGYNPGYSGYGTYTGSSVLNPGTYNGWGSQSGYYGGTAYQQNYNSYNQQPYQNQSWGGQSYYSGGPYQQTQQPFGTPYGYQFQPYGQQFTPTATGTYTPQSGAQQYLNANYVSPSQNFLTASGRATLPATLTVENSTINSDMAVSIAIIDPLKNDYPQLDRPISLNTEENRSVQSQSCLEPNHSYTIMLYGLNGQFAPISLKTFSTPATGGQIYIRVSGQENQPTSTNEAPRFNVEIQVGALSSNLSFQCPTYDYSYTGTGLPIFSDQQLINLQNYYFSRNPQNGDYILISRLNQQDYRTIIFVDRGNGQGGLAFLPDRPDIALMQGNLSGQYNYYNGWYTTNYIRDNSGNLQFVPTEFTRSQYSPYDYARIINGVTTSNFQGRALSYPYYGQQIQQ